MTNNFPFNHFFKVDSFSGDENQNVVNSIVPIVETTNTENKQENEFSKDELTSVTDAILDHVKNAINPGKFNAYFANNLTVSSISDSDVEFVVTTPFIKKMIESHYIEILKAAILDILGKSFNVLIIVLGAGKNLSSNSENILKSLHNKKEETVKTTSFFIDELEPTKEDLIKAIDSKVIEHNETTINGQVDPQKTFNNFVIGPSNNIAHAFAMAVAKDPGRVYPALYIYGNSGLGKTHLTHAIANFIQNKNPSTRICMTSANRFMNEMVEAIKMNKSFDFRKKYSQNTDVLIIDDVHELKNKNTTQEMFFHIFNELIEKGKQLIFTSDKIPKEIDGLEDRIRTRLSSALPVEIQQPDFETRIAILKKKAVERDVYLSDEVVNLIAKCIKSNIRELEGCLIKLGAVTSILKVDIDLEVAKEHLKLSEELENQKNLTIESLTRQVAHYYKIPIGDIRGKTKNKEVVHARQVAMYLISKLIKPTLKENGHFFSGRDHSTVLHAIKIVSDRVKFDSQLSQQLLDIEKQI